MTNKKKKTIKRTKKKTKYRSRIKKWFLTRARNSRSI